MALLFQDQNHHFRAKKEEFSYWQEAGECFSINLLGYEYVIDLENILLHINNNYIKYLVSARKKSF